MSRALVAGLAVLLLVAPAAAADVPLLDDVRAADVALAGRAVLVAREHRHGRVTVDALDPVGGAAPRRVLTVPSPGRDWVASVAVTASPLRVAVLVGFDDDEGNTREWRVYSGPPAGPVTLLRRVRRPPAPVWVPMSADVDGDRLLLTEFRLSDFRARAQILAPGAAPATFPWPGNAVATGAIAGDRIAFLGSTRRSSRARVDRVFVAELATGAVVATLDIDDPDTLDHGGRGLDLAPDGRVIAGSDGRLLTVAPGVPQAAIPGSQHRSLPHFAGARIVALAAGRFDTRRPVVIAPDGRSTPLGGASTMLERLVADEHGAAWIANGCVRYAPLDGSSPVAPPAACPSVEVLLGDHDTRLRGRTLRIKVTCVAAPAGECRGKALLRSGGIRARGRFSVPAGARRLVAVRFTPRAARRVRAELRRYGEAVLRLDARVRDGRVGLGQAGASVFLSTRANARTTTGPDRGARRRTA